MQVGWNHRLLCDSDDYHCTASIPVLKILSLGFINLICSYEGVLISPLPDQEGDKLQ